MIESHPPPAEAPLGPAVAVAERWADFTKTFAIYPEANQRVTEALGAFRDALADATGAPQGEIEILFHHEALRAGGEEAELRPGTNLKWLHDRIHKAALAGVALAPDVSEESVFEFTRRLLANFTRRDLDESFLELWPQEYAGIRLVERRFEGQFGDEGVTGGARTRSWGESTSDEVGTEDVEDLVALLAGEERIQRRLLRMKTHLMGTADPEEEKERVDLLGRLVHLLPKDAIQEYDAFVDLAAQVLDHLEERLQAGTEAKVEGMNQLLFAASRGLLAHEKEGDDSLAARLREEREALDQAEDGEAGNAESAPRGHAGDDDITDDREALLAEIEDFPPPAPEHITAEQLESTPEILDVLFHTLVGSDSPAIARHIHGKLADLLRVAEQPEISVLREYLTTYGDRSEGGSCEAEYDRILRFLLDTRQAPLLRKEGLLQAEIAARDFPRYFGLYLDSLDPGDPEHLAELRWVMEAVGSEALSRERSALIQNERLLDGERTTRLFLSDDPTVLPLTRFTLQLGDRDQKAAAAWYLKRLNLEAHEADLLRRSDDPSKLPLTYLLAMAAPFSDGSYPAELARDVTSLLCQRIEALGREGTPHAEMQRVTAIEALARFRSQRSKTLLTEILSRKRMWVLSAESKAVREAARRVLNIYGAV